MLPPYNNNNQGLGLGLDRTFPRYNRGASYMDMDRVNPVPRGQNRPTPPATNPTTPVVDTKSNSGNSLGNWYDSAKKSLWGESVPQLGKDAAGNFNTKVMNDAQWDAFYDAGGKVGAKGQLYNADGSAFDLSKIEGVDASKLGTTTEGGLGSVFSSENIKAAGDAAKSAGYLFNAYQAGDDIFGKGAKSRREAERRAKQAFEQNFAMNAMAINKFKEDNEHFKQQRAAITASY